MVEEITNNDMGNLCMNIWCAEYLCSCLGGGGGGGDMCNGGC